MLGRKALRAYKARMDALDLAELHGVWLSSYFFDGAYSAAKLEQLDFEDGSSDRDPVCTLDFVLALYEAAKKQGYAPRGIVSHRQMTTKAGDKDFVFDVDGPPRVYVGIHLPFKADAKSKFAPELPSRPNKKRGRG